MPLGRRLGFLIVIGFFAVVSACSGSTKTSTTAAATPHASAVVSSSSVGPGQGLRTMIDGDISTGWTGPEVPYWFEIDLGEQLPIATVRLLTGRDLSGEVRVHVGVHDNPGRQPGSLTNLTAGTWVEVPVGYEARFVRVWVDEGPSETSWLEVDVVAG